MSWFNSMGPQIIILILPKGPMLRKFHHHSDTDPSATHGYSHLKEQHRICFRHQRGLSFTAYSTSFHVPALIAVAADSVMESKLLSNKGACIKGQHQQQLI